MEFHVHVIRSPSVPAPTSCQGTRATKRTPTYPSSTKHNHLKILASRSNDPQHEPGRQRRTGDRGPEMVRPKAQELHA